MERLFSKIGLYKVQSERAIMMNTPRSYDLQEAFRKGLTESPDRFSPLYCLLQARYREALSRYLLEMLPLESFDREIESNELGFLPVERERQSVYQFYDCLGLKFFYLRNNLHIERLSAGELETLKDSIIEKSPENEEAVSRLVESSWKNIISISEKGADKFIAIYEMNLRGNKEAPGNALVFELATMSSFDENGNFTDFDKELEKDKWIFQYRNRIVPLLCEMAGDVPVRVFIEKR
ncbi:MAG TPA: hypothetical protein PLP87_05555 [Clostridiales bacterium]|nr:hypothetical protein [Clostridiales bacterium]